MNNEAVLLLSVAGFLTWCAIGFFLSFVPGSFIQYFLVIRNEGLMAKFTEYGALQPMAFSRLLFRDGTIFFLAMSFLIALVTCILYVVLYGSESERGVGIITSEAILMPLLVGFAVGIWCSTRWFRRENEMVDRLDDLPLVYRSKPLIRVCVSVYERCQQTSNFPFWWEGFVAACKDDNVPEALEAWAQHQISIIPPPAPRSLFQHIVMVVTVVAAVATTIGTIVTMVRLATQTL